MKSTRIATIALLVIVCAFGWLFLFNDISNAGNAVRQALDNAEELRGQQLYQLAIDSYKEAIAAGAGKNAYDAMIDTGIRFYEETHTTAVRKVVSSAFEMAVKAYPKEAAYWTAYADMYAKDENYSEAARILRKSENAKASGDELEALKYEVYYKTKTMIGTYDMISKNAMDGLYLVSAAKGYGIIGTDGAAAADPIHPDFCAVGEDSTQFFKIEEGVGAVYNKKGTMIARVPCTVSDAKGFASGLIPVKLDEGRSDWCYLDEKGQEIAGGFLKAGIFQRGRAAVQNSDGSWAFINVSGEISSKKAYDEIKIDEFGRWTIASRCCFKIDGKWHLYDSSANEVGTVSADDMDICLGSGVAYSVNGKWGFLDNDGNVMIEPQYEAARSFSGGVAAICVDGAWGFIDKNNKIVVDCIYEDAGYFDAEGGSCPVCIDGVWRLITWVAGRS